MSDPVVVEALMVRGSNGQELFGPTTFRIAAGTVTALTGPSGSGKTTLMRALLGHLPTGAIRCAGSATVAGFDVLALNPTTLQRFRRTNVAYVGQDPGSALNPLMRVRTLLDEVSHSKAAVSETLELVGLSAEHLRRRPGELSGGQQRRVALARALVRNTGILILDEPLAGLHGALRTEIARLLADIAAERAAAILLSGHDTATIHAIADNVVELGATGIGGVAGPIRSVASNSPQPNEIGASSNDRVELSVARRPVLDTWLDLPADLAEGIGDAVIDSTTVHKPAGSPSQVDAAAHRYPMSDTKAESESVASAGSDVAVVRAGAVEVLERPDPDAQDAVILRSGDSPEPLLRARDIGASIDGQQVLAGIDLVLSGGSALAVAGASGAGKTTLARVIAGLHHAATGSLELAGEPIPVGPRRRTRHGRNGIQLVTQNPRSALNPRRTVAETLGRPLRRIGKVPKRSLAQRVIDLLDSVELAPELATRYPHELSGGQRQRVALARALAADPAVLVCDEITSALDHDTAVAIMMLLDRIRAEHRTGLLVITHDVALITGHCSHVIVLDQGRIVESGSATKVLTTPAHPATRELLG
ncbi:ATP-binding cassette domain-containing protein [Nocardia sp. NPDC004604]|uniref:ABC transporter ATP-binding protein n=1 Tax=Nocardia sp. NPDC004604 TaxID=3157013 RepID=UPI0033B8A2EB